MEKNNISKLPEPAFLRFLFSDTRISWLWLLVRVYVGWAWLTAGWGKVTSPMWVGPKAGAAITGFLTRSLTKTTGEHPDVSGWYADFIKTVALPNSEIFSYMVAFGELFVGIALILGIFTGVAAFFGAFMNVNYLFAGTLSTNPLLLVLEVFIMCAWKIAGWIGLDRFVLPLIVSWKKSKVSEKHN